MNNILIVLIIICLAMLIINIKLFFSKSLKEQNKEPDVPHGLALVRIIIFALGFLFFTFLLFT